MLKLANSLQSMQYLFIQGLMENFFLIFFSSLIIANPFEIISYT